MMSAILRKEMRSMLRERRSWLIPVIYAAVLAAIVYMLIGPAAASRSERAGSETGTWLAQVVAVVQTLAVLVFAPLVGAATIASERERGTLALLLASPGSRVGLGLGKLTAAVVYSAYLLAASVPIAAVAFLYGGPDAASLLGLYTTHLLLAVTLVCIGMAVSTVFQRTWTATLAAIGLALALVVVTFAVYLGTGTTDSSRLTAVLYFNPAFGVPAFLSPESREFASHAAWLKHYGALGAMAVASVAFALRRLERM